MMTQRTTLILGLLLFPAATFALDFTDMSSLYSDAPFTKAENAGISVLTNLGAVSGNPDGTFAPNRAVNRAEFLKILFESQADITIAESDSADCFPDVKIGDWFSRYVCAAKVKNIVAGHPDGFFRPADSVNYAEAVKILAEAYDQTLPQPSPTERWAWYTAYLRAAAADGVSLPIDAATPLTRGQVARLAAGYRAWDEGVLTQYRAFERGQTVSSVSSTSSSSSSASSSSVSSSSVSSLSSSLSSSAASSTASLFPATSHFMLIGERSPIAFDGTFTSPDEDGILRFVDVTLRKEVKSIQNMTLIDGTGNEIGTLVETTDNNTDHRKWRLTLPENNSYRLVRGAPTILGVAYNLRSRDNGGVSNEFIDGIETFSITIAGAATNASKQIVPVNTHYPQNQTSDSKITGIRNAGSGSTTMFAGPNRLLGRFAISAKIATGGVLNLSSMRIMLQTTNVSVSNIRIGGMFPVQQADCGVDSMDANKVTCLNIPEEFRQIGPHNAHLISLVGDVSLNPGATLGALQVLLPSRGKIGQNGVLTWKDAAGTYNWIEAEAALENGMAYTVEQ